MLHFPFKVVENTPISFTPNNHKTSAAGAGRGGQVIGPSRHHFSAAPPSYVNATPADGFTEVSLKVTTLHLEDQQSLSKVFGGITPIYKPCSWIHTHIWQKGAARLLRPFRFSPNCFQDLHLLLQLKTRDIHTVPANLKGIHFSFLAVQKLGLRAEIPIDGVPREKPNSKKPAEVMFWNMHQILFPTAKASSEKSTVIKGC